ncbi:MAG: GNAT family N-acetyltransferase, partial [Bdellovibrionaceae bacterium]|nr:GNAT family N-acetyltransferase [Pseudobdellovibrionaceae bacterium]
DDLNVNIFYVLSPNHRGKGYFKELLKNSITHCREKFYGFHKMRALTKLQNVASVKGLESCSFVRKGTIVENVQPDVVYEEYIYHMRP